MDLKERFLKFINKTSTCWFWQGAINNKGYGRFRFNGKWAGAHRVSYMIFNNEIPEGLCVLHKCDNRNCVNPKHLFVGTIMDNHIDMIKKGRQNLKRKSILTDIQKQKIPLLFKNGYKAISLAVRFGVHESTIRKLINNQ